MPFKYLCVMQKGTRLTSRAIACLARPCKMLTEQRLASSQPHQGLIGSRTPISVNRSVIE